MSEPGRYPRQVVEHRPIHLVYTRAGNGWRADIQGIPTATAEEWLGEVVNAAWYVNGVERVTQNPGEQDGSYVLEVVFSTFLDANVQYAQAEQLQQEIQQLIYNFYGAVEQRQNGDEHIFYA